MKYKSIYLLISAILFAASVGALLVFGLKPGIDFSGGSLLEYSFSEQRPDIAEIQNVLSPLDLGTVVIQPTKERGVIIRTRFVTEAEHQNILLAVRGAFSSSTVATTTGMAVLEERVETVGPSISAQLRERALGVAVVTVLMTLSYIGYAFRRVSKPVASWKYGTVAIAAMIYNIIVIIGLFAILGRYAGVEVDIPFVVALMTVFGYSINDTIVVFDRVRENIHRYHGEAFSDIVNRGINETIVRSLTTGGATLLVLAALFLFGGATIHYFALALIVGILFGTSSSIFVASSILVAWEEWRQKRRLA